MDGFHRSNTPYIWPPAVVRSSGPKLAYLDLNHWIGLAKAAVRHADGGRYEPVLAAARLARTEGRFLFPLSGTHYQEMSGITDPRQRADITAVMEELSGFSTLLSQVIIARFEVEAVLDIMTGPRPVPLESLGLVGRGVGYAFGRRGGLRIRSSDGSDATAKARTKWPGGPAAFDQGLANSEMQFERQMLAGPADEDVPPLLSQGWDPTVARRGAQRRADQEMELKRILDAEPHWRRGRLRDIVSARYLAIEMTNFLRDGLVARNTTLGDLCSGGSASARRLVDSMPSGDVYVSLVTFAHRNGQSRWTANDIFDIDAMSVSVAYCDLVATERHRCQTLRVAHIGDRLATQVVATPEDLVKALTS